MICPMPQTPARSSRFVPTEQLMPPVPIARALTFAGIAALLGAVAWGSIAFYAHYELGYLAWGIGALVGFAAVKAGGHGNLIAFAAGALALLSIGSGKNLSFRLSVDRSAQRFVAERVTAAAHAKRTKDATDWVALGNEPTPEQLRSFTTEHEFDFDDAALFAPRLRRFAEQKPTLEQWRDQIRGEIVAEASFVGFLQDDFHPADILFVLLGIASAFGLVANHTTRLHVAVREAERRRREAEAEDAAPRPAD